MIWWMRHGQSTWNAVDRLQGHESGPPLTDLGREQVRLASQQLAHRQIERLVASPAVRAQQSADIVGAALGLPVATNQLLLEKGLDESVADVLVRIRAFIDGADQHTTLAVSHGDTIGLAIGLLSGQAPSAPVNASILGVAEGVVQSWAPPL